VPFLFDGRLPDINLGSVNGTSCAPARQQAVEAVLRAQTDYSWVANGRFKGGYITRQYAKPQEGIETLQLELAQCNYMDEESFEYDERVAERTQKLIRRLVEAALS
jgi:N-formylglutamate deformylase